MTFKNDEYLDVYQNIEFGLKQEYEKNENLTDRKVIYALENAKVAVKQEYGFAKNEKVVIEDDYKGVINWCVYIGKERINKVNNLKLKNYISSIDKIRRSVNRHANGHRGYYDFIKNYV